MKEGRSKINPPPFDFLSTRLYKKHSSSNRTWTRTTPTVNSAAAGLLENIRWLPTSHLGACWWREREFSKTHTKLWRDGWMDGWRSKQTDRRSELLSSSIAEDIGHPNRVTTEWWFSRRRTRWEQEHGEKSWNNNVSSFTYPIKLISSCVSLLRRWRQQQEQQPDPSKPSSMHQQKGLSNFFLVRCSQVIQIETPRRRGRRASTRPALNRLFIFHDLISYIIWQISERPTTDKYADSSSVCLVGHQSQSPLRPIREWSPTNNSNTAELNKFFASTSYSGDLRRN